MQWRDRATAKARRLRRRQTDAEALLWARLRNRALSGWKFRRQYALGPYVADFICLEACLIVEIDGGQHATRREADARRTAWLHARGFRVLRLWNHDLLANLDGALQVIEAAVATPSPSRCRGPLPLPQAGEGRRPRPANPRPPAAATRAGDRSGNGNSGKR
jgi:very-short-patch-repair endonuclease